MGNMKLKELLGTGVLEGLYVTYVKGAKARMSGEDNLQGKICGSSVLCFCKDCKRKKAVLTPNQFEIHAGSRNKRPPDSIYLDNGKNLRYVLNECKDVRDSKLLEEIIRSAISESRVDSSGLSNNSAESCLGHTSADSLLHADDDAQMNDTYERSSKSVLSSDKVNMSASINKGKRKSRKKHMEHKLFFESDLLPDKTKLAYYDKGEKMLEGVKKGKLISCECCDDEVSPSQFECHAGFRNRRQPYRHIYTSNMKSLHQLSFEATKDKKIQTDESDDDVCLNNMSETGTCPASNINAVVDPMEQNEQDIPETTQTSDSECFACRGKHFDATGFSTATVMFCDQCERQYHMGCLEEKLECVPDDEWFCTGECEAMYSVLQQKVKDGLKTLPKPMLRIIQHKQKNVGSGSDNSLNLKWRLLHGKAAPEEHKEGLSHVDSLLHDNFNPIRYGDSIKDLMPMLVYGESRKHIDFSGMYCAVLFKESEVVCAAIFRIFGNKFAELPLAATREGCQGRGYCQALLGCVENLLASMGVKELILPATEGAEWFWKNKLAFEVLREEQLEEYLKDYPVLLFEESTMLHKPVTKPA